MPLLQVRDFPGEVYEQITLEARRQNRTIAQQTIVSIRKGLGHEASIKERRRMVLERINSRKIPEVAKTLDHVKLIREDRDR